MAGNADRINRRTTDYLPQLKKENSQRKRSGRLPRHHLRLPDSVVSRWNILRHADRQHSLRPQQRPQLHPGRRFAIAMGPGRIPNGSSGHYHSNRCIFWPPHRHFHPHFHQTNVARGLLLRRRLHSQRREEGTAADQDSPGGWLICILDDTSFIKRSYISEKDVIGSFVPIILLPVVVGAWTGSHLLRIFEARIFALEYTVVLQHLQLPLLPVLLLNLLYYVVVFVVILHFGFFFEPGLSDTKTWFFDDQVGIFLLLFDDSCGNIIINDVVGSHGRPDTFLINNFPLNFGFES